MSLTDETRPMPSPPAEPSPPPNHRHLVIGGVAVLAVAVLAGAFLLGRASGSGGSSGPSTFGEALTAARTGALPCGTTNEVSAAVLQRLCNGQLGAGSGGGAGGTGTGRAGGGGARVGTVTTASGNQVTVQTAQGALTLTVGSDAAVRTLSNGAISDLAAGTRVLVTGSGRGTVGQRQIVVLGSGGGALTATPTS